MVLSLSRSKPQASELMKTLKDIGINVEKDEKLAQRLAMIKEYYDLVTSDKLKKEPLERIKILDELIARAAVAWGRGGNNKHFLEMMHHWKSLIYLYKELCSVMRDWRKVKERIAKGEIPQEFVPFLEGIMSEDELIEELDAIAHEVMLPAAWVIIAATFMNEDVAPHYVIAIQNMAIPVTTAPPEIQDMTSSILQKAYKRSLGEST